MDQLRASLRDVPIVDRGEYRYFVHPITDGIPAIEPALLRDVTNEIVRRVDFDCIDRILVPEAMGIHVGTAVSLQVDIPLVIARKRQYKFQDEVSVAQETGYSDSELHINGIDADHSVVVIDDVISTGGTHAALTAAVEEIGAQLSAFVVVFDKRDDAQEPGKPLTDAISLMTVAIEDDSVIEVDIQKQRQD